jgi:hypothetical protein
MTGTIATTIVLVVSPSLNADGRNAYSTRGQLVVRRQSRSSRHRDPHETLKVRDRPSRAHWSGTTILPPDP